MILSKCGRSSDVLKHIMNSTAKQTKVLTRLLSDIQYDQLVITPTKKLKTKPTEKSKMKFGKNMSDHMLVVEWTRQQGWNTPHIIPFGPIPIIPSASVLHYGLEVFEGMKAYRTDDGSIQMFRPEENMKRFYNSSVRMSLPAFNKEELLRCIAELVRLEQDWIPDLEGCSLYIRPTAIATEPSLGVRPPDSAMIFCVAGPTGPYFNTGQLTPISLLADPNFVRAWPGGVGDCKAGGNYAPTILALKMAEEKGCSQCLWLYKDQITEVGTMNIFMYWINDDGEKELLTPPLNGLILPGITRKSLLELAREWDEFKVSEREFTMKELLKAVKEKRVIEFFGAGTAAVVSPVEGVLYEDKMVKIGGDLNYTLSQRFYKELTDIQYGRIPHHWNYLVDSPTMKKVDNKNILS